MILIILISLPLQFDIEIYNILHFILKINEINYYLTYVLKQYFKQDQ